MLFGDKRIQFAPLHIDDFVAKCSRLIVSPSEDVQITELAGPEDLSGSQVATRLARQFTALPIPIWWPVGHAALRLLDRIGVHLVERDQLQRLVCKNTSCASAEPNLARFFP